MPERLTIYQLAQLLGVSTSTVYRWMYEGIIPRPQKDGHRIYWNAEQMIAWRAENYPDAEINLPGTTPIES